jgi:hypothetical protein
LWASIVTFKLGLGLIVLASLLTIFKKSIGLLMEALGICAANIMPNNDFVLMFLNLSFMSRVTAGFVMCDNIGLIFVIKGPGSLSLLLLNSLTSSLNSSSTCVNIILLLYGYSSI